MSDWKDKYRPKDYPNKDWPPLVYVGYADNEIAKLQAENVRQVREIRNLDAVHREKYAKLQAEVRLQSDSADHWEDEAMNHMSQAAKLKAERDSLMNDMQRIYDNCSDADLIIDIAGAALEVE